MMERAHNSMTIEVQRPERLYAETMAASFRAFFGFERSTNEVYRHHNFQDLHTR